MQVCESVIRFVALIGYSLIGACSEFTLDTNTNPTTCTLFSANSGGVPANGYISGSPSH